MDNTTNTNATASVSVGPESYIKCNKSISLSVCGREAVCHNYLNESYCLCPDSKTFMPKGARRCKKNIVQMNWKGTYKPLTINFKRTISAAKFRSTTSINAYNDTTDSTTIIVNDNSTNYTLSTASERIIQAPDFLYFTGPLWIISVIIGLFAVILAFYLWWKCCKSLSRLKIKKSEKNKTTLIPLDKTVMKDQRYTSNPQYFPHTGAIPMDISIGSVPLLNRNSITDLKKIGEGFFGEVYRGLLHSIDNGKEHVETVAIKMLKETASKAALEDFLREVEIISSFQHPNILTLVGVCPQENSSPPWMIFEYMSFGDLADVLRNSNPEFSEGDQDLFTLSAEALLLISSQIAAGMEYLAAQRFVHRDLACRNCLVGSALTVKISDFGMSRDVYTCDYYKVGGNRMLPIRWMSPEGLSFGKFTLETDIWSYGVVLWEIYSYGKQPFYGYTNEQAMKLIVDHVQLEIPENCPNEIGDIMSLCWQINPKDRIQFLDICNRLSALKEHIDEISVPPLPRPPPMPVTINYPIQFDDEEFDDILDDDNYLRPTCTRFSMFRRPSNSSLKRLDSSSYPYMETLS